VHVLDDSLLQSVASRPAQCHPPVGVSFRIFSPTEGRDWKNKLSRTQVRKQRTNVTFVLAERCCIAHHYERFAPTS
jgi:hypothetical protein